MVTEESDQGSDIAFDRTGDAFVVGTAELSGTRITAEVKHDDDPFMRERLVT
ncbi:MAG: hypothetical protein WD250_11510 [Egibacteraceae bacterium]